MVVDPMSRAAPQPVGALPLPADEGSRERGRTFVVHGGPFDAFAGQGFGLCLEVRSRRAAEATVVLDVPDYGVPEPAALDVALARLVDALYDGCSVYIGCKAGQGRTGLAMACLAHAFGIAQPIAYVRRHYSPRAVETERQARFVTEVALPLTGERIRFHRQPKKP